MGWPFQQTQEVTRADIYAQLAQLIAIQRENATVLTVVAKNCVKLANDSAAIRRLLWRHVVRPSMFEVVSEGENMGYMNKRIILPPVKDDVVRQEVRIESPGKTSVYATLDETAGQSVGFSVLENTEVTISLQYFDNVGNPSTVLTRTVVIIDDVPPEGPEELQAIVSDSETAEPAYAVLADVVVEPGPEEHPVVFPPSEDPPAEDPPVDVPPAEPLPPEDVLPPDEPPVEEPPVVPTGPTGPTE